MKFKLPTRRGRRVDPPAGAATAHEHVTPDGRRIVITRNARGKLLPGNRLCDLRVGGEAGTEARNPQSVVRAALGLPSRWAAADQRRREQRKKGGAR